MHSIVFLFVYLFPICARVVSRMKLLFNFLTFYESPPKAAASHISQKHFRTMFLFLRNCSIGGGGGSRRHLQSQYALSFWMAECNCVCNLQRSKFLHKRQNWQWRPSRSDANVISPIWRPLIELLGESRAALMWRRPDWVLIIHLSFAGRWTFSHTIMCNQSDRGDPAGTSERARSVRSVAKVSSVCLQSTESWVRCFESNFLSEWRLRSDSIWRVPNFIITITI